MEALPLRDEGAAAPRPDREDALRTGEAPELSVVVPCFNERERIDALITALARGPAAAGGGFEVLIVDDGSTDGTAEAVLARRREWLRLLRCERNRGKGHAVRLGMARARGRRVLFCDADLSTPFENLAALGRALDAGHQVAIGSRGLSTSRLLRRQPPWREVLGRSFNVMVRLLSALEIRDTQCGFKLFTREAARKIFPLVRADGWSFDVEVLLLARKLGLSVAEVPVTWVDSDASSFSALRHGLPTLAELLRIRLRWLLRDPTAGDRRS